MFHHILIPVDGSEVSKRVIEQGVSMAKLCSAKVLVVHVISLRQSVDFGNILVVSQVHEQAKVNAKRYLDGARVVAEKAGVPAEYETILGYPPYEAILRVVATRGCDLIIMGLHGRYGVTRPLSVGSETHNVLLRSDVPVMVCC